MKFSSREKWKNFVSLPLKPNTKKFVG